MSIVEIPISDIHVEKDFNPRSEFEVKQLEELALNIKQRGLLQPLIVRQEGDTYWLIAGERRLRACRGVLDPVPCIVRNSTSEDPGERLLDSLVENLHRVDLSVADEVMAYKRLKDDHGWNAKRIAHETGFAQNRVTQRMQLLALPADAIEKAAELPVKARRALVKLAESSPGLAGLVAKNLSDEQALNFVEKPRDTIARNFRFSKEFPVLAEGFKYLGDYFDFTGAAKELYSAYEEAASYDLYIGVEERMIKRAKQLEAVVELSDGNLIVGWDVCNHLAGEELQRIIDERNKQDEQREADGLRPDGRPKQNAVYDDEGKVITDPAEASKVRKREYAEEQERRKQAMEFNDALAAPLLNKGTSHEFTPTVARLVSRLLLAEFGSDYYMRGLRYLHPSARDSSGKVVKYADRAQSEELLNDWIGSARKADEILGRTLVVLLAAQYADVNVVAMSNRAGQGPHGGGYKALKDGAATVEEELERLLKQIVPQRIADKAIERYQSKNSFPGSDEDEDSGDPGPEDDKPQED